MFSIICEPVEKAKNIFRLRVNILGRKANKRKIKTKV
jgi:hypothetical protein